MMSSHDRHDRHDRFLVAALAAGDLETTALDDAQELVAACAECAELLADLRSIAAATAALPTLPRPTDFRLSPDTAERLGARGVRGLLVRLADSRFGFSRPLAVGLTTLGLVGVIAGSIPGAMGGAGFGRAPVQNISGNVPNATQDQSGAASGAEPPPASALAASAVPAARQPGPPSAAAAAAGSPAATALYPVAVSPAPEPNPASPAPERDSASPAPTAAPYGGFAAAPSAQATEGSQETSPDLQSSASESTGPTGPPALLVGSLALLLVGLGILGAQWAATRLTNRRIE
jgi:hypothetical protein